MQEIVIVHRLIKIWLVSALFTGCAHSFQNQSYLTDVRQRNVAFLKTRGSLDPNQEVVFYWKGSIYARSDDAESSINKSLNGKPVLQFEGFNIARFVPTDNGIQMLSREVSFYFDSRGEVVDCWTNPYNGLRQKVVHVYNDPVNFKVSAPNFRVQGDSISWFFDVNLVYPSPLSPERYGEFSAGETYRSMEIFNFLVKQEDLRDETIQSAPTQMTWSRVGQFLPWMKMGSQSGELVYSTSGYKVLDGFAGLPQKLRELVLERAPKYTRAPQELVRPNMTSWRFFKQEYDNGNYEEGCIDSSYSNVREK